MEQRRMGDIMQMLCSDELYSRPEIAKITGIPRQTIVWFFNKRKIPVNCEVRKGNGGRPIKFYLGSDIKAAFFSYQRKRDRAKERHFQERHVNMVRNQDLLPGVDYEGEASVRQEGNRVTINRQYGASSEVYDDEEEASVMYETYNFLLELLDFRGKLRPDSI